MRALRGACSDFPTDLPTAPTRTVMRRTPPTDERIAAGEHRSRSSRSRAAAPRRGSDLASKEVTTPIQDSLPFGTIREPGAPMEADTRRSRPAPEVDRGTAAPRGPGGDRSRAGETTGAPERARDHGTSAPARRGGGGEGDHHEGDHHGGGRRGRRRRGRRGRGQHARPEPGTEEPRGRAMERENRATGSIRERGDPNPETGAEPAPTEETVESFAEDGLDEATAELADERATHEHREPSRHMPQVAAGMFVHDKGGFGVLRRQEFGYRASREDVFVPKHLILREKLRDGSVVEGRITRGQKHKYQLMDVASVDGRDPAEVQNLPTFQSLTSIDPDFHYAVGDGTDNVSMRIVDILSPIGRGQRGLIVAPPRTGKTTIMRQFAHGIETVYPDVHLMVLLVDERPEEATEWQRSLVRGQVYVSTADETAKNHIQTAEAAWLRAMRLVELGEDVVILLDSITRLARAYNNQLGTSGKTMSGGLDSRAMERPRKIFGSARNTETAGSLTILGTTLIETGSRMDQLVFEEFKGTGNMELVLSRKLADRRIFPAIDLEKTGTRKEEKLVGLKRLKRIHTLRRVLARMNWVEAMELLITKLEDDEKTDDFLARFEVDPEAGK